MKKIILSASKKTVNDEWLAAAITNDQIVAELLIRLKHAETAVNLPPLRWGIRQKRSRSSRFGVVTLKKDVDFVRASPKTPLSWSGGGGSASPDEFEDTSRQASCSTSTGQRSKIFPSNVITNSLPKRLKNKKSSYELQDEEKLKLKERLDLKKEVASLRATLDEENLRNQRLKKIKLDLNSGRFKKESSVNPINKSQIERQQESRSFKGESGRSFFVVPDLNMLPSEDEILYGRN